MCKIHGETISTSIVVHYELSCSVQCMLYGAHEIKYDVLLASFTYLYTLSVVMLRRVFNTLLAHHLGYHITQPINRACQRTNFNSIDMLNDPTTLVKPIPKLV